MSERTEKLSVEVEVRGHDAAAKDVETLKRETAELTEGIKEEEKALTSVTEQTKEYGGVIGKLREKVSGAVGQVREMAGKASVASDALNELSGWAAHVAFGVTSVMTAIRATSFAIRRLLPGVSALTHAGTAMVGTLRDEVKERLRLIEVMKIQSQASDELKNKQLSQKDRIERISDRRRVGGFTADAARLAQVQAARAKEQFGYLDDAGIERVVGTFGDVGLSQENLTNLAIIESFGGLDDVDVTKVRSKERIRRIGARTIKRFPEEIAKIAQRETVQGVGLGRAAYRTGQPTEAMQQALAEMQGAEGGEAALRRRLEEELPPGVDLDRAVRLAQLFGSAEAFEAARISRASPRGVTATENILKARPTVEVGLPDQPGYVSQALGAFGGTKTFETMDFDEFEGLRRAYERIEREGQPGSGFTGDAAGKMERAAQSMESAAARLERVSQRGGGQVNYNPRFYGPDAASRKGRTTNGERLIRDME